MGDRLERMEVFAFGHLIEDLLGLVERKVGEDSVMGEKDAYVVEGLNLLHWRCTDPVVVERPLFKEVMRGWLGFDRWGTGLAP